MRAKLELPYIRKCDSRIRRCLGGGVQLRQEGFQVAQALSTGGVLESLVLGQDVDEALAYVVAVPAQQLPALIA